MAFFFPQQFFHGRYNRSYTKFVSYGSCSHLLQTQIRKSLSPNPSWNGQSSSSKHRTITQFTSLKETGQSFHKKSHVIPFSLPLLFGLWEPLEVPSHVCLPTNHRKQTLFWKVESLQQDIYICERKRLRKWKWHKETKKTEVACLWTPQPTQGTARNITSTCPASVEWPATCLCYLPFEM